MRLSISSVILFSFFTFVQISGQGQSAIPFMMYQPSPEFQGSGSIGVAKPAENPMGFYTNPAQLGYYSTKNRMSVLTMPKTKDFMGLSGINLKSHLMSAGFDLERIFPGLPVSVGFGYMNSKMSFREVYVSNPADSEILGKFSPSDEIESYSAGMSFKYYAYFNLGVTFKRFNSQIVSNPNSPQPSLYETDGNAYDLGAMIILPVSELFLSNTKFMMDDGNFVTPNIKLSTGYSITNIGDEIYYNDPAQSDPLSRVARLGYSLNFGFDFNIQDELIKLFDYSLTIENSDILVEDNPNLNDPEYQNFLGDISLAKNLIGAKSTSEVTVHKGHSFNLFETITVFMGTKEGRAFPRNHSGGYALSTSGISKLIKTKTENKILTFIVNHLELNYYDIEYEFEYIDKTRLQSLSLSIKNIGL
jgi:hypothetical protein